MAFPQILLSNVVSVNSSKKEFWTYHNKINRKTIDFIVFEKTYFKPVMAIEYDGRTHNSSSRKERDNFVDGVLEASGIKCLHVKHSKNINFEEVRLQVNEAIVNNKSM